MTAASVSADELAGLLASLGLPTPTPAAPAAEPRCTVTDLLTSACAHCRPAPPAATPSRERLGPWIAAQYRGKCAGCGGRFEPDDRIRADGDGGYLGDCCGTAGDDQAAIDNATQTIALAGLLEQPPVVPAPCLDPWCAGGPTPCGRTPNGHLEAHGAAAIVEANKPAAPAGPPPSTVTLMRDVLRDLDASRPRSLQKNLGPSELGTPCQRQIAMKLAGVPRQPASGLPWAPMQGTAVHGLMEEALRLHNKQLGRTRWVIEEKLQIDDEVTGHGDAFDNDTFTVVDWKHTGTTTLREVRRKTVANHLLVKPEYRVQAHLYGLGHQRAGRTVRWVRLVFLARSHDYNDSAEWTEAFDPEIAYQALFRYYGIQDLIKALNLPDDTAMWDLVPAEPGKACSWCPFRRVGGPADGTGCPGDLDSKADKQLHGLIAP